MSTFFDQFQNPIPDPTGSVGGLVEISFLEIYRGTKLLIGKMDLCSVTFFFVFGHLLISTYDRPMTHGKYADNAVTFAKKAYAWGG